MQVGVVVDGEIALPADGEHAGGVSSSTPRRTRRACSPPITSPLHTRVGRSDR